MVTSALKSRGQFTGLRPLNVARDLGGVADVLEAAFADELDAAQWAILREIKRLRFIGPLLWLFSQAAPEFDPFMPGFVWIERGRLVGNVTVTRLHPESRHWLISNVAVHPDFRRRGIGRELVSAALDLVESRQGDLVMLEVRHDNEAAQALYRGFGFKLLYATVHLRMEGISEAGGFSPPPVRLRRVRPQEWPKVYSLARTATPRTVQRLAPVRQEQFEMTLDRRLSDWIAELFQGRQMRRWAVEHDGAFVAVLTLLARRRQGACEMTLLIHPEWRGRLEASLAAHVLDLAAGARPELHCGDAAWALEAGLPDYLPEAIEALECIGFTRVRTQDRLVLEL